MDKKKLTDQEKQDALLDMQLEAAPKARVFDILSIATVLLIVFGLGAGMFILPDREFSEQENRMLMQFPEIASADSRLGRLLDGSFTRDIADYYADQLPLRDIFTRLKGIAEIGMLKRENNGVILARHSFLVPRDTPPDYELLQGNINHVEIFSRAMAEAGVPVTLAMAPRTMDVLRVAGGHLPAAYPARHSRELWAFYNERVSAADISGVNLLDGLYADINMSARAVYFRTDHHWTTFGAFRAYHELARALGVEPRGLDSFEIEVASEQFFGTTWSAAGMPWVRPDRLEFFRFEGDMDFVTSIIDTGASFAGFYDRAFLDTKDKYGAFIGGVNTWVEVIRPGVERPRLLLIKDSFAHAAVPFLAYHYELVILDLRGFSVVSSVARVVQEHNIEQVLFLYNIGNFKEDRDIVKILTGLDIGGEVQAVEFEYEEGFTSREIVDRVMESFGADELPEGGLEYFFSGAEPESMNYLSGRSLGIITRGEFALPHEFNYIYDFAFVEPVGYRAFEIFMLRVSQRHLDRLEDVRSLLEARRRVILARNIPVYEPRDAWIVNAYRIITVDNYVVLLQTTDNDRAENIIREMLGGEVVRHTPETPDDEPDDAGEPDGGAGDYGLSVPEIESAPEVTAPPILTVRKYSHNTMFLLGGRAEDGAWVSVTGGLHDILTRSDRGDFLVEVPFDGSRRNTTLTLTTFVEGKEPSPPIEILVRPQTGITMFEDAGRFGVVVGYNYFTIFADSIPDFIGSNLISEQRIAEIQAGTEGKIRELRSRGSEAEIIYLLVPNTARIFPELMPRRFREYQGERLRDQWIRGVTAGGATVIDLLPTMLEHKYDEFKVFHFTDSHWSEYGAMLAYFELMNHIGQRFPDALPRPRSDFHVYNRRTFFGDIFYTLNLPPTALREYSAHVRFNFEPPCGRINLYDDIDSVRLMHYRVSMRQTTHTNLEGNFPNAYIIRDSFAGPIHAFMTDRFATAEWAAMWDYRFRADEIAGMNADYVIYIISERNIPDMMRN